MTKEEEYDNWMKDIGTKLTAEIYDFTSKIDSLGIGIPTLTGLNIDVNFEKAEIRILLPFKKIKADVRKFPVEVSKAIDNLAEMLLGDEKGKGGSPP